jgi:alpha-tubulin suppressor-like RCC1 family protein
LHTCAVTTGGLAYCWGANTFGQLGDGTATQQEAPVAVSGGLTFSTVSATGASHTCGVTSGGAGYCWGWNGSGELGDGSTAASAVPVPVTGGLVFAAVSAGGGHTCGLTTSGSAYCWGLNDLGQLGDGTTTQRTSPVAVSGGLTFGSIDAGFAHVAAIAAGGAGYSWGSNTSGELGDGTTTNRTVPTLVAAPLP